MSSLQALLDAQDKKGGSSERRGYSGGSSGWSDNRRGSNRSSSSYNQDGVGRGIDYNDNFNRHDNRLHYTRNNQDSEYPPKSRGNNNSYNNSGSGGRSWNPPTKKSHELTYEERRANIEKRAIEDSLKSSRRISNSGVSSRWNNANPQQQQQQNQVQSIEDDIESLQSWVGPLHNNQCTYYQDRDKRYPFYTNENGYNLLQQLMERNKALLHINHQQIIDMAETATTGGEEAYSKDVVIRIGQGLYSHKPTLRTRGVTWSTEEYSHPGLQRMYLRMKSIQRFTEVWCLLERCDALGIFDDVIHNAKRREGGGRSIIRIAAVGGGPGYELLATKLFFAERAPEIELELISMDVCPAWRPYVEQLGFKFVDYDIDNEEGITPIQAAGLEQGQTLDFVILSCVMIYVTNEKVLSMFNNLITQHDEQKNGVNAILVSERGERTKACTMMEELGGKVIRLIDQSNGMDERQAIWCSEEFAMEKLHTCSPDYDEHQNVSVFPNVPYCEHKERRGGRSKKH